MYKRTLLFLLTAPLLALAGGDLELEEPQKTPSGIYKSVGPDGRVTFSDTPPKDRKAEQVDLKPTNVQPIALPRPLPQRRLSPRDTADDAPAPYTGPIQFAIVSPQDGATIPPGQRYVELQVALEPMLPGGHQFFVVVNGQPWSGTSSGTSLDISALDRGSHTLQAVLLDTHGNRLAESQVVQVYVHRPGGQVPDAPAPQAQQAPKAPVAPGVPSGPQPRRR